MLQNIDYWRNTSNIQSGNMAYYNATAPTPNAANGVAQVMNVSNSGTASTVNSGMWCQDTLSGGTNRAQTISFAAADKVLKDGGVLIPNRIFVGGIGVSTTGTDLFTVFSSFGVVRSTRIVMDQFGSCRGYGFVTFSRADVVTKLLNKGELLILKSRNWNIAPAVRRNKTQPMNQAAIMTAPPTQPLPQPSAPPVPQQLPQPSPQPPSQSPALPLALPIQNMGLSACQAENNVNQAQPLQVNAAISETGPNQAPQMAVPFNYDNKCPNLYFYVIS